MTSSRCPRRGQLVGLLAQLGAEQPGSAKSFARVRAWAARCSRRALERARERTEAAVLAPAGAGVEVAEAGAVLAHDEARAVAIAVEVDAQQLLGAPEVSPFTHRPRARDW